MKAVIQRVSTAQVVVDGVLVGRIGTGILTYLGVAQGDDASQAERLVRKIAQLRIFEDSDGKMNRSLLDVKGGHLIVSQFTLCGDVAQGNRPGFSGAAHPSEAEPIYERALEVSRALGIETASGRFGADMEVTLVNDGPATFVIEI